jgi:lipoprotein signal peptidase
MADVIRIDQHRRPTTGRTTPPGGRRPVVERDVPIRVVRSADLPKAPAEPTTTVARAAAALTEPQLAARFFPLAFVAAAADLASKAWAISALSTDSIALGPGLSLSLAYNRASAGGVWLGENTRALNFTATGIIVGLVIMIAPELVKADRRSWRALALIAGAGLGNMASLLSGRGVPDFIALHHGRGAWVLNVADLVLVAGLALLGGTVARLARAASRQKAVAAR